jgi:hypothetical protein
MTSDVLDKKLNKENQICNFSSFFNEKCILLKFGIQWIFVRKMFVDLW